MRAIEQSIPSTWTWHCESWRLTQADRKGFLAKLSSELKPQPIQYHIRISPFGLRVSLRVSSVPSRHSAIIRGLVVAPKWVAINVHEYFVALLNKICNEQSTDQGGKESIVRVFTMKIESGMAMSSSPKAAARNLLMNAKTSSRWSR